MTYLFNLHICQRRKCFSWWWIPGHRSYAYTSWIHPCL